MTTDLRLQPGILVVTKYCSCNKESKSAPPSAALIVLPRLNSIPTAAGLSRDPSTSNCNPHTSSSKQERLNALLRFLANKLQQRKFSSGPVESDQMYILRQCISAPGVGELVIHRQYYGVRPTAGMTPAAPLVGEVTMRPPL